MRRRSLLTLAVLTGAAAACAPTGSTEMRRPRAENRLRIPPLRDPRPGADGVRRFPLTLRTGHTEFLTGKPAETWGINGSYLGPTLRMRRGDLVAMDVRNQLPQPSTLHWHGMRLPARMDGGPHQTIATGGTWSPQWRVDQPAATLWYHPHPHGETADHVWRGLAGMIIIADDAGLPARYGHDDIPLVIQDRVIGDDGEMEHDKRPTFGLMGDDILVNGTLGAQLEVYTTLVRFRLLNGSNARVYHLGFADGREFHVVAGDAGLLTAPAATARITLSPGERAEIVVAFAPGEPAVLRGFAGDDDVDDGNHQILRISAAADLSRSPALPDRLPGAGPVAVPAGARVRRFKLSGHDEINDREMDMNRVDEVVPAGAREIWEVRNAVYAHNFHIHGVDFTVLDVDGTPPPAWQAGRKDTVYLPPKKTARLAVEFDRHTDAATPYMYHCHILRHEDDGMMGQFTVVPPGTESWAPRTVSHAGHHR
ncbi:multicopper oxidase family protein [Actinoplanes aureus]|nr:multicopper oxidase domain-containing protein [Actinoplanes aureus]